MPIVIPVIIHVGDLSGRGANSGYTGAENTCIGYWSGRYFQGTNPAENTLMEGSGTVITTGSNNTIGKSADPSAAGAVNQIVIGHSATGQGNNYAVIGNANITRVYMAQDSGATVYCGGLNIGSTNVSSTATELNLVDGSTAGTIVNSKAVIYGSSGEVNATTLQIGGEAITQQQQS